MIEWNAILVRRAIVQRPLTLTIGAEVIAFVAPPNSRSVDLLRVAAGVERPRSGDVRVLGKSPESVASSIGFVGDRVRFPRGTTVREYVGAVEKQRGGGATVEPLRALGIEALADSDLGALERGEAKAVALAVALRAKVPILEEPFVELDARAHEALRGALVAAKGAGKTVLFSTASTREALLADRVFFVTADAVVEVPRGDARMFTSSGEYRLQIESPDVRAFIARIVDAGAIHSAEFRSQEVAVLATRDPEALLLAIQTKVASGELSLRGMTWVPVEVAP